MATHQMRGEWDAAHEPDYQQALADTRLTKLRALDIEDPTAARFYYLVVLECTKCHSGPKLEEVPEYVKLASGTRTIEGFTRDMLYFLQLNLFRLVFDEGDESYRLELPADPAPPRNPRSAWTPKKDRNRRRRR